MSSWRVILLSNVWWMVLSLAIAVAVGVAIGWPGWMSIYGVVNVVGVFVYSAESDPTRPLLARILHVAAIVQLPAGLLGLVGIFSSSSPTNSDPWVVQAMYRTPRLRDDAKLQGESEWPPKRWP